MATPEDAAACRTERAGRVGCRWLPTNASRHSTGACRELESRSRPPCSTPGFRSRLSGELSELLPALKRGRGTDRGVPVDPAGEDLGDGPVDGPVADLWHGEVGACTWLGSHGLLHEWECPRRPSLGTRADRRDVRCTQRDTRAIGEVTSPPIKGEARRAPGTLAGRGLGHDPGRLAERDPVVVLERDVHADGVGRPAGRRPATTGAGSPTGRRIARPRPGGPAASRPRAPRPSPRRPRGRARGGGRPRASAPRASPSGPARPGFRAGRIRYRCAGAVHEPTPAGGVVVQPDRTAERRAAEIGDAEMEAAHRRRVRAGTGPAADRLPEQWSSAVDGQRLIHWPHGRRLGRQFAVVGVDPQHLPAEGDDVGGRRG